MEPFNLPAALSEVSASALVDGLRGLKDQRPSPAVPKEQTSVPCEVTIEVSKVLVIETGNGAKLIYFLLFQPFVPYKDYFDWSLKTKLSYMSNQLPAFLANIGREDRIRASRTMVGSIFKAQSKIV